MATDKLQCTCGKKYQTIEKLAEHANKTNHLQNFEEQYRVSWFDKFMFNLLDGVYTFEGALVAVLAVCTLVAAICLWVMF